MRSTTRGGELLTVDAVSVGSTVDGVLEVKTLAKTAERNDQPRLVD